MISKYTDCWTCGTKHWTYYKAPVKCLKCQGAGWVWGHELDDYNYDAVTGQDDTRYSCDRCESTGKVPYED